MAAASFAAYLSATRIQLQVVNSQSASEPDKEYRDPELAAGPYISLLHEVNLAAQRLFSIISFA